ncbi:C2 domain [Dillenia turbinata]|uniref:C2 domain n=1 Tax=Dillenia turbinata TaxID=194707 RepID=A0AAN8WDD7_9MAGN
MSHKNHHQPLIIEITVISAQGLKKKTSSIFSNKIRPFVELTTVPPYKPINGDNACQVYNSTVYDEGGVNPTWGDKFRIPVDPTFFTNKFASIYLQIYTKRLMAGQVQLGWCQIPSSDIIGGYHPVGTVRYLSYRLRAKDGYRGHGVVNVAVKLESQKGVPDSSGPTSASQEKAFQTTALGIPVTLFGDYPTHHQHVSWTTIGC